MALKDSKFVTRYELADRWRVDVRTVDKWSREGKAPPLYKINGTVLYKRAEIEDFEQASCNLTNS